MIQKPVVVITGAAGGIGKATVIKFAQNGYIPVLIDVNHEILKALSESIKGFAEEFLVLCGDLQKYEFLKEAIDQTIQRFGRIDILINNAAWRSQETMRNISIENWEKTIRINLTAPAFLAKYAAESMEKNKIRGVIINISSVMSKRTGGYSPAYSVCKGGLESLTHELAVLYGPNGIRSVAISPGNVETNMSSDYINEDGDNISKELLENMNDNTPLMRAALPTEIANVAFWLSSKEASFITGTTIEADGGFSKNFNSYTMKARLNPSEF